MSSGTVKWTGSVTERNVGQGQGVAHIGEDGTAWLDVEEEVRFPTFIMPTSPI